MKKHLHKFLTRLAEHHATMAQSHSARSEHFSRLAGLHKAERSDTAAAYEDLAAEHSTSAAEHIAMGNECVEACKTLGKAVGLGADFDELVPLPENFSRIVPDVPGGRITAVPRFGSAPLGKAAAPNVPPEFRSTFSIDPEQ